MSKTKGTQKKSSKTKSIQINMSKTKLSQLKNKILKLKITRILRNSGAKRWQL